MIYNSMASIGRRDWFWRLGRGWGMEIVNLNDCFLENGFFYAICTFFSIFAVN